MELDANKKIPYYEVVLDESNEDSGLSFVSLVTDPAIMEMGLAFNTSSSFKFNKDKQVIVGPAMIPNVPLYRNINGEEFYVVFTEDVIEKLAEKFNRKTKEYKINIEHGAEVKSAFIKSNWIIEDIDNDKSNMYGFSFPKGSWMLEVKVDDTEFWNEDVKEAGRFGFSVEGLFGLELIGEFNKIKESKMEIKDLSPAEVAMIKEARELALAKEDEKEDEVVVEAEKEDEKEEVKEEEVKAEDEVVEEVVEEVEEAPVEPVTAESIMEIVQPKIDELAVMIAELKTLIEDKEVVEDPEAIVEMSKEAGRISLMKMFRTK